MLIVQMEMMIITICYSNKYDEHDHLPDDLPLSYAIRTYVRETKCKFHIYD